MTTNNPELKTSPVQGNSNDGCCHEGIEAAAERAKDAVNAGMDSGRQAIENAMESASAGIHVAQQKFGAAVGVAREAASQVSSSVSDAASYATQKAEGATNSVGCAMESTGTYLKDDGLRHIAADVSDLIRRNPVPAMLVGIGLGFLIAQASTRRNP